MMVKDNRVLRRQKGKLLRALKQQSIKVKNLQQQIIQNQKQLEKDRLLFRAQQATFDDIQRFITNRRSILKLQKIIDKYPTRINKMLKQQLQMLQTSQNNTLHQKIQFVSKAMNDVQDIYGQIQDYMDQQKQRKLLFNMHTQTIIQNYDVFTNTPQVQKLNVSTNTRKINKRLFRNVIDFHFDPLITFKKNTKRTPSLRNQIIQQESLTDEKNMKSLKKMNHKYSVNSNTTNQLFKGQRISVQSRKSFRNSKGVSTSPLSSKLKRQSSYISEDQKLFTTTGLFNKSSTDNKSKSFVSNIYSFIIYPSTTYMLLQNLDFLKATKQQQCSTTIANNNNNGQILIMKSHYYKEKKKLNFQEKNLQNKYNDNQCQYVNNHYFHYLKIQNQVFDYSIQNFYNNNIDKNTNLNSSEKSQRLQRRGSKIYAISNRKSIMAYKNSKQYTGQQSKLINLIQNMNKQSQKSISSFNDKKDDVIIQNKNTKQKQLTEELQHIETPKIKKVAIKKSLMKKFSIKQNYQNLSGLSQIKNFQITQNTSDINSYLKNTFQRNSVRRTTQMHPSTQLSKLHKKKTEINQDDNRPSVRLSQTSKIKKRSSKQINQKANIIDNLRNLNSRETLRKNNNFILKQDQIQLSQYRQSSEFQKSPIFSQIKNTIKQTRQMSNQNRSSQFKRYDTRPGEFQKTIRKIIKSIFQRKNELLNSQFTMNEFLKSQFQFLYGPKNSLQSFLVTLGDIKYQKFSMIMSFQIMLSVNYPQYYLQDLFKLYIFMIQKANNLDIFNCQKEKAQQIIYSLYQKFFNSKKIEYLKRTIPYWTDEKVDLHDCFIPLTMILKQYSFEYQLYEFLTSFLPPSQGDLSFQQLKQFLGIFKGKSQYTQNMFRLKLRMKNERIPIHRLSIYCHNNQWKDLINIQSYIQQSYTKSFQQLQYQQSIKKLKKKNLREFPWIKSITDQMIDNYYLYGKPIKKIFIQYLTLLENNHNINNGFPLSDILEFIQTSFTKILLKRELIQTIK